MKLYGIIVLSLLVSLCTSPEQKTLNFYGDTSGGFIIRWSFQERSDHVYDMTTNSWQWPTSEKGLSFDPAQVQSGDIVFMRNAPEFFQKVHPHIKHPYLIVTMGEWRESVQDEWLDYLDDETIIGWFSIHGCRRRHPKFHLLPLGIFQRRDIYTNRESLDELFLGLRKRPKTKLLYSNYGDMFNKKPERKELNEFMRRQSWCSFSENIQGLPFIEYMKEMADYKFVLSPRGYGIDCYRTWEALLVGSIPIVRHSQLDSLYEGLPVLVIDQWTDLSEEFLMDKYHEISSRAYDIAPLFVDFWFRKFDALREPYRDRLRK